MNEKIKNSQFQEQLPFQPQVLDETNSNLNPVDPAEKSEFDYFAEKLKEPIGETAMRGAVSDSKNEVDHKSLTLEDNEIETTSAENLREKFKNFLGRKATERSVRLEIKGISKEQKKNEKNEKKRYKIDQREQHLAMLESIYGNGKEKIGPIAKVLSEEHTTFKQQRNDLENRLYRHQLSPEEYLEQMKTLKENYKSMTKPLKPIRVAKRKLERTKAKFN